MAAHIFRFKDLAGAPLIVDAIYQGGSALIRTVGDQFAKRQFGSRQHVTKYEY